MRVSVCHCLACQKRTGSAFGAQARWPNEKVHVSGDFSQWTRQADSGSLITYRFCPSCGSTISFEIDSWPGVTAVPLGAFAGADLPPPRFSVYEHRKHEWVEILGDVEHSATPSTARMDARQGR